MSRFKVSMQPTKPRVDEQQLAAFSAGAESRRAEPLPATASNEQTAAAAAPEVAAPRAVPAERPERATESFLLRLTPSQVELLNFVFERSTVKSKQKLVESILVPELERQAEQMRQHAA